jgi:hypothetical protein
MSNDVLNVGIYGYGSMGRRYLSHFLDPDGKGVHFPSGYSLHVIDSDSEVLSNLSQLDKPNVRCYESFNECLSSLSDLRGTTLDLVFICTPASLHDQHLIEVATNSSRGILVEKPLTSSSGELLGAHVVSHGLLDDVIGVGYNFRYHPYMTNLYSNRELIQDITVYVADDMREWPGKSYDSPLLEYSHELDMVACLTGSPFVSRVTMSSSQISIVGHHRLGKWRVRIRPFHKPSGRWIRLRLIDGTSIGYHWDVSSKTIEATYRIQADALESAWMDHITNKPWDLRCSLADGFKTTELINQVSCVVELQDQEVSVH